MVSEKLDSMCISNWVIYQGNERWNCDNVVHGLASIDGADGGADGVLLAKFEDFRREKK